MPDVALRCACGEVRGLGRGLSPRTGVRLVCMCDDCQTWAHFLGEPSRILDRNGGTEVFQTTPARLTFHQGADRLDCARLGPRGPLRWYTSCCRTPVANGLASPRVPFASVVHAILDLDETGRDAALGPVRARVNARFGKPPVPAGSEPGVGYRTLARSGLGVVRGFLAGEARPSPFFDDAGQPLVTPTVLPLEERRRLRVEAGFPR